MKSTHLSRGLILTMLVMTFIFSPPAFSDDVPAAVNYQGKLTDNAGNALTSGY